MYGHHHTNKANIPPPTVLMTRYNNYMKASSAKTVDEFIAESPAESHAHLEQIRTIIKSAVPDVSETMGYGKPYYKYHGWMTGVTLYTKHLGVEIWDGLSDADREQLEAAGYKTGSKNFQIKYDQEIPVEILTRLVQAQAKRNAAK
jgi:uncharacterized protein YdhG (YjbR/CyaY superfamily)